MRKFVVLSFIILSVFAAISCSQKQGVTNTSERPAWFYKPGNGYEYGGVGIAGRHVRGLDAQRKLAISRAVESIASQMGVEVSGFVKTETTLENGTASSNMQSYTLQTVTGKNVKAVIKEFWEDPYSKELYVWMVVE
ncbi:hypothetical protein [Limisalsivibrio acetivorans]|uniref:hypothetical protein n=1 Tax=Limisalsivibrio acetivorans TaxID=1304888 RepID=UPI0003B50621|nr:hypothetical protein [Limisalsivibrio acetivorans]